MCETDLRSGLEEFLSVKTYSIYYILDTDYDRQLLGIWSTSSQAEDGACLTILTQHKQVAEAGQEHTPSSLLPLLLWSLFFSFPENHFSALNGSPVVS